MAVVDVDGMELRGAIEQLVEGVAAGAGDHDHAAVGFESEQLAIKARILPARVVDQLSAVDMG